MHEKTIQKECAYKVDRQARITIMVTDNGKIWSDYFSFIDTKGVGRVTRDQVEKLLELVSVDFTNFHVAEMLDEAFRTENATMDASEFTTLLSECYPTSGLVMKKAFRQFGNVQTEGEISTIQLKDALTKYEYGSKLFTPESADRLLQTLNNNANGTIDYENL